MNGRKAGLIVWAGVLWAAAGCASSGSDTSGASGEAVQTISVSNSCSAAPMLDQLGWFAGSEGAAIVRGVLEPTGTVATVGRDYGGTVGGEYRFADQEVMLGDLPAGEAVWVEGGQTENLVVDLSEPQVFASPSGEGVFLVTPGNMPGRLAVIQGFPVVDGAVLFGYGCSVTTGLSGTPSDAPVVVVTPGAVEQPAAQVPADGVVAVPVAEFAELLRTDLGPPAVLTLSTTG